MVDCFINDSSLSAIADAIRAQTGNNDLKLYPYQMAGAIQSNLGNVKGFIERSVVHFHDDKVTSVAPYAFYQYKTLSGAYFPNCISIGTAAFEGCTGLKNISVPLCSSMTAAAFTNCKNITNATLGISEIPNNATSKVHAFVLSVASSTLETLDLPNCTSIGNSAFLYSNKFHYAKLNKVTAPNCTYIGNRAFSGGTTINTIEASNCVAIGIMAFNGCTNLSSAYFSLCATIGESAFNKCTNLTDVYLPVCSSISTTVFAGCTNISNATICVDGNVTSTNNPFAAAIDSLETLHILNLNSESAYTIGVNAFRNYTALNKIDASLCSQINTSAFDGCTSLEDISFPRCEHIGMSAFCGCTGLMSVDFDKCIYVDACAFQDCTYIEHVNLPVCTHIGHSVFANCTNLTNLTLPAATVANLDNIDAFANTPITGLSDANDYGYVYVPNNLLEKYKSADHWSMIADRISAIVDM